MEHILDIQQNYSVDDSIKSYEYFAYQPISGTQLNSPGEITIRIENQDAFFYPRKSWIEIEGTLTKAAAAGVYADTDVVTLVNNGPMFLFENIKYELSGQEIETVYHPGQATTILGLCKYSKPFMNQCWTLDTGAGAATITANDGFTDRHNYIIKTSAPKGSFRFSIPLDHVFGFCEDYDKIMYGFVHSLTMVRGSDDNAIFRLAAAGAGKVTISSLKWLMPKVVTSDADNFRLYKIIESKATIDVGFRMRQLTSVRLPETKNFTWRLGIRSAPEKPRFIMIAFQTDRDGSQEKNTAIYDHCKLTNIFILLNNVRYPAIDFNASFTKNHYDNLYKNMVEFIERYYGIDSMIHSIETDPVNFKALFPILLLDVSKQSEMFFEDNVLANTNAHALLISDRKLKFKSDGKKMNIIY